MIRWIPRAVALEPVAVAATGASARQLAAAVLRLGDDALLALSGVTAADLLILLGDSERLPWCDGALYFGRDLEAPSLLLPTSEMPTVHVALLEGAVMARVRSPPVLVLHRTRRLISVGKARPVERTLLLERLEAGS